jgi:multidrug efflux system outer membrane protein
MACFTNFQRSMMACLLLGMFAGCAVGPDYHREDAQAPASWSSALQNGVTGGDTQSAWWTSFHDSELDALIRRAAQSNLDLRAAESRLRQARALREGSAADFGPTVNASASALKQLQSKDQPLIGSLPLPPSFPFEYKVYQAGFDAAWEIDVFGGKRRALEVADAELQGTAEARNDVLVSVLAEVARDYIELRGAQQRLEIARRAVTLQQETVELNEARLRGGVATDLDLRREAALLASVQASVPPLETAVRSAMYSLAALLGRQPDELVAELTPTSVVPPTPPEVPIGLPSDLLRRRPDVRNAERQLAAETARIGVAKSNWFPKFSLTGDFGSESVSTGKWFESSSRFWSFGPNFQWRLFDFGRVRAEVNAQTAVQEESLVAYQKAVLTSLREAESAVVAYAQEQNRRRALAEAVADDQRSLELANALYAKGRVNYLDVLDVRRNLYQATDLLAQSDQAVSVDLIALYKALGGGWETLPPAAALENVSTSAASPGAP